MLITLAQLRADVRIEMRLLLYDSNREHPLACDRIIPSPSDTDTPCLQRHRSIDSTAHVWAPTTQIEIDPLRRGMPDDSWAGTLGGQLPDSRMTGSGYGDV